MLIQGLFLGGNFVSPAVLILSMCFSSAWKGLKGVLLENELHIVLCEKKPARVDAGYHVHYSRAGVLGLLYFYTLNCFEWIDRKSVV